MCTGVYQCMLGYQVIIPVIDNYKSSVSCKMSGVKYVRNQVITDRFSVLSGDMPSDHTTSVNISSKSTTSEYTADINSRIKQYRKMVMI